MIKARILLMCCELAKHIEADLNIWTRQIMRSCNKAGTVTIFPSTKRVANVCVTPPPDPPKGESY